METQIPLQTNQRAGSNSYNATDGTQLDPTAVALAKSIRKVESNDNYNAVGDGGKSHGAYQFYRDNFHTWASQYGLDPQDTSPVNQDKVAYHRVKDLLDQGNALSEVAARWNGATFKNGKYQAINPTYVEKVKNAYGKIVSDDSQQNQNSSGYNPHPYSNPSAGSPGAINYSGNVNTNNSSAGDTQNEGLGQDLLGRVNKAGEAIQNTISGKINPVSGVLQTVGAGAGAVNDVVGRGLELIPGVKQLENLLGHGVGALAKTSAGQSVVKSIKSFTDAHPELSDDIGAGFNIVTAIPIFKGLGAVKGLVMDSAAQGLKSIAEKGAIKDLTEVLSRTSAGRDALDSVPKGLETIIKEKALPEFVTEGGVTRYNTESGFKTIGKSISKVDDRLQAELSKANLSQVSSRVPLEDARNIALQTAKEELKDPNGVNTMFDRIKEKYGDYPTLQQLNDAKRTISKQISEAAFGDPNITTNKAVRKALQTSVEEGASKMGLQNIHDINQEMANLIKTQDMLSSIDGKTVKNNGLMHQLVRGASTAGGAFAGGAVGNPTLGGIVGNQATGFIENKLKGLLPRSFYYNMLKRTEAGAAKKSLPKIGGLLGASIAKQSLKKSNPKDR